MRRARLLACCPLALSLGASCLHAQQAAPDTTDFHKGQWAAQFTAGTTFQSAGVLYFRSKGRAWLFDGSLSYYGNKIHQIPDTVSANGWSSGGTIRAGLRGYRPLGGSILFFHTFGLVFTGGQSHESSTTYTADSWNWGLGAFGEVGANYMLTPHLSLGAAAGLRLLYTESQTSTSLSGITTGFNTNTFGVSVGLLSLVAAVYF